MLITCPECSKQVSDKATACPNCGYPLNPQNIIIEEDKLEFPALPDDLTIGKQLVNWTYDAAIEGFYENNHSDIDSIPNGKIHILLHQRGINICVGFFMSVKEVNFSQIIDVYEITQSQLENKSVIKRAMAGGILLGPLGAIVGGMSGIGTKNKNLYYLCINYWDIKAKNPITISIGCKSSSARFIKRLEEERKK